MDCPCFSVGLMVVHTFSMAGFQEQVFSGPPRRIVHRPSIDLPTGRFPDVGNHGLSPTLSHPPVAHPAASCCWGPLAQPTALLGGALGRAQAQLPSTLSIISQAVMPAAFLAPLCYPFPAQVGAGQRKPVFLVGAPNFYEWYS